MICAMVCPSRLDSGYRSNGVLLLEDLETFHGGVITDLSPPLVLLEVVHDGYKCPPEPDLPSRAQLRHGILMRAASVSTSPRMTEISLTGSARRWPFVQVHALPEKSNPSKISFKFSSVWTLRSVLGHNFLFAR